MVTGDREKKNVLDRLTRPLKDKLLNPIVKLLGSTVSPNTITLFSFLLGLGSVYFILYNRLSLALVFWLLNRIFDGLDGAVAREGGVQSDFGGYLDILVDFILYAMIPFAFTYAFGLGQTSWIFLAGMISLFYINSASWMYLSAILEKRKAGSESNDEQTSITMPSAIVEGTETIIIFTLFYLFPLKINLLFTIMTLSLLPGICYRLIWAWKKIK